MRGIIFTGGESPRLDHLRSWVEPCSFVIAADSGLTVAERAGFFPDLVLGDMDSLEDRSLLDKYPTEKKRISPRDKDLSDTELALEAMKERGVDDIVLIGGNGGRMDHFFALRLLFDGDTAPSLWLGGESAVVALGSGCVSRGVAVSGLVSEDAVSVFSAAGGKHSCRGTGFHWAPDTVDWDHGAFSLSNRSDTGKIILEAVEGRFLLVVPFREGLSVSRLI